MYTMNLQKFKNKGSADNEMPRPLCNLLFVKGAKKKMITKMDSLILIFVLVLVLVDCLYLPAL